MLTVCPQECAVVYVHEGLLYMNKTFSKEEFDKQKMEGPLQRDVMSNHVEARHLGENRYYCPVNGCGWFGHTRAGSSEALSGVGVPRRSRNLAMDA